MNNSNSWYIFLTGSSGCLGKDLVKRLLSFPEVRLCLLMRRKGRHSHWDRARKILAAFGLDYLLGTRVEVLEGDIAFPHLGLQASQLDYLRDHVDEFYHVAALTALNGSEEDCRQINTEGTREALKVAWDFRKHGRLKRFFYYSTAFVAGSLQTYCAKEDELPANPAHANFYESSKYQAETSVRQAMREGMPCTIFRPSIVVGDSRTGEVSEFNVIYPFMRLFAHGVLSTLPSRLDHSFNIVPIDYVIESSVAIARMPDSMGKTYHLVTEEPPTLGELLRLKETEFSGLPPIQLIDPDHFRKEELSSEEQMVFEMLQPYLGYLNGHLSFDTTNTRGALEGTGIASPKTDYEFLRRLVQFAVDAGYLVTH